MAPFATPADVAASWPSYTSALEDLTETLLASASAIIRSRVPAVDARISAGQLSAELARTAAVQMVIRVLRNPDGYRQETAGSRMVTFDAALAAGELRWTAAEADLLMERQAHGLLSFRTKPLI